MRAIALRGLVPDPAPPEVLYGYVDVHNFVHATGRTDQCNARILVNGSVRGDVISFNDEAGWVDVLARRTETEAFGRVREYGVVRLVFLRD